jgi:predicted transcriptional regulator
MPDMSTTSLKLPDALKARAASAAKTRGVTTHAFMLDAIREAATATEQRARFVADAKAADAEMRRSGKGFTAEDVHKYLRAKVARIPARRPKAKSWRA